MLLFRLCKCCCWKLNLSHLFSFHFVLSIGQFIDAWSLETDVCQIEIEIEIFTGPTDSDFVTNSYSESWDSFCEKSLVPVQCQWVPIKKKKTLKLKMLGPLCNQTVNLKTDSKTLCYSILKLKYSPSILKHNKGWKKYTSLNNSHYNNFYRN